MNAPTLVDWNQHLAIVIVYAVLLYSIAVVLIRRIAIAKGYNGRNWLILALAFLPVAAVAVAALPNRALYQRICEIRDAAQLMVNSNDQPMA